MIFVFLNLIDLVVCMNIIIIFLYIGYIVFLFSQLYIIFNRLFLFVDEKFLMENGIYVGKIVDIIKNILFQLGLYGFFCVFYYFWVCNVKDNRRFSILNGFNRLI